MVEEVCKKYIDEMNMFINMNDKSEQEKMKMIRKIDGNNERNDMEIRKIKKIDINNE